MKTVTLILSFLFYALLSSGQVGSSNFAQAPLSLESEKIDELYFDEGHGPKITGQLLNFEPEELDSLQMVYSLVVPFNNKRQTGNISVELEEDGRFAWTLKKAWPYQQMWFGIKKGGTQYYWGELFANSGLHIILDLQQLKKKEVSYWGEGISFSGSEGKLTELTNIKNAYKRDELQLIHNEKHQAMMDRKLTVGEKVAQLKSSYEKFKAFDQKLWLNYPNDYIWFFDNKRMSDYYGDLLVVHWGKEMEDDLFAKVVKHQPLMVSNESTSYYKYLSTFLKFPNQIERIKTYKKVIGPNVEDPKDFESFIDLRQKMANKEPYDKQAFKQANNKYLTAYKAQIDAEDLALYVQKLNGIEGPKSDILKIKGAPDDLWRRKTYIGAVLPTTQTQWGKEILATAYEKDQKIRALTQEKLAKIKPLNKEATLGENVFNLDGMQFYQSNQKTVEELLQDLRTKYEGKGIILDIWATWCMPCIDDMKKSKSKKEELRKLPLEIVYLCSATSSNMEVWKRKVAELEVKGDHIFLDEKLTDELLKFFDLRGYPSYIFLDQEGKYDRELVQRIQNVDVELMKERLELK